MQTCPCNYRIAYRAPSQHLARFKPIHGHWLWRAMMWLAYQPLGLARHWHSLLRPSHKWWLRSKHKMSQVPWSYHLPGSWRCKRSRRQRALGCTLAFAVLPWLAAPQKLIKSGNIRPVAAWLWRVQAACLIFYKMTRRQWGWAEFEHWCWTRPTASWIRALKIKFARLSRNFHVNASDAPMHQTLFFTATWPEEVRRLAKGVTHKPYIVTIGNREVAKSHQDINQVIKVLDASRKGRHWFRHCRRLGSLIHLPAASASCSAREKPPARTWHIFCGATTSFAVSCMGVSNSNSAARHCIISLVGRTESWWPQMCWAVEWTSKGLVWCWIMIAPVPRKTTCIGLVAPAALEPKGAPLHLWRRKMQPLAWKQRSGKWWTEANEGKRSSFLKLHWIA